ncbi:site-specific integrase [Shewanella sp. Isolate11]|uniref:site-specific integrase n=1 Tax=Shewanella sp. Isolate11 TaxID=2908530 RepID=UPI001EFDEF4C|nr:site-specific integrase [Shewanella sp. Isolate11]MCG9698365.1 site-specific integrase [Shewanella sp. Isolate11]
MARPKSEANKNLPAYLRYETNTGDYRLTLTNGSRRSVGKIRSQAIQIAIEYNRAKRPSTGSIVDDLIKLSGGINGEQQPFAEHVDKLLEIIFTEESLSKQLENTMLNDANRVKEFFNEVPSQDITLKHVHEYLNKYHENASANVHNRKLGFLKKLFAYAIDQSLMLENPASLKMKKRNKAEKQRQRLSVTAYRAIHAAAEPWLQIAMELALQSAQGRLETSRIKYRVNKPKEGQCGCQWWPEPIDGIYGTLFIHRQKVENKEASHVAIPIGKVLKESIDRSRDGVVSPYVVHRVPDRDNKQSTLTDHRYQVDPNYLSRSFSDVRDELGLFDHLEMKQRPSFHEIRALAARLFSDMGVDPQARLAHTDSKSTKVYVQNHLEWTEVPHAEIKLA